MKDYFKDGIRLQRINNFIVAIAAVLAAFLFALAYKTLTAFRDMQDAGDRYATSLRIAAEMQETTGYLTDRVRTFVFTGEEALLDDYFAETERVRRREKASEDFRELMAGTSALEYLEEALRRSVEAEQIEHRAIRLAADAYGISVEDHPVLTAVELTEAEQGMSNEEKKANALSLLFDETYQELRRQIVENVRLCEDNMINEVWSNQKHSKDRFQFLLVGEAVLVVMELLLLFFIMLAVREMMIDPMETFVRAIERKQLVTTHRGAYELRFLSRAYNTMFAQLDEQREELSYRATHDHLTGLYNRAVFDREWTQTDRKNAVILVDVDHFKAFNDIHGHDVGDRILQKVSKALQSNFRPEDFVCRIGGDEFAIVMAHADSSMRESIEQRLQNAAAMVHDTSDALPEVILSAGVAFSDRIGPGDDLYKDADIALYRVKNRGRGGIAFF